MIKVVDVSHHYEMMTPILAEVADKEPSLTLIWSVAAFFCAAGFFACRCTQVCAMLVLILSTLWAFGLISELRHPDIGPAILQELGRGYITQAYTAALIPFVFMAIAFWIRRREPQT